MIPDPTRSFGPQDALRLSIEDTGTLTARDLPMPLVQAARLLETMRMDGTIVKMLPGVHSRLRTDSPLRGIAVSSRLDAIAGYARAHGRIGLPSPAEAANMVGLTLGEPDGMSYVWNGPARLVRIRMPDQRLAGSPLRFDPMPLWAVDRLGDPNVPFLLALSHRPSSLGARELDAFVRRMGPDASTIAASATRGMPRDLVLCLQRLKRACVRVLGDHTVDATAVVRSIAADLVPSRPFDSCRRASARLVRALTTRGVRAEMVQHEGHLVDRPDADPRWLACDRSSWIHWAVEVPKAGLHVDLTFGQFDASFEGPRIMAIRQARAEWRRTH